LTKEIIGDSRVVYDEIKIIEGNFTRKFTVYENDFIDDAIDVTVQNKMLPLGVRYLHRVNKGGLVATVDIPKTVSNKFFFMQMVISRVYPSRIPHRKCSVHEHVDAVWP